MIIYHNLQEINKELLNQLFNYCDGSLYWKVSPAKRINVGDVAGTINESTGGYRVIKILSKQYLAHRLIFFMFNNYWPDEVDHIDGDITNNRIENLRASTKAQNQWNSKIRKDNTSGVKGVHWSKRKNMWSVRVWKNKKTHYLGYYTDLSDAEKVVKAFRVKCHGEYANDGKNNKKENDYV